MTTDNLTLGAGRN